MARPNERLAASLERLRQLQESGRRVFRSREFARADRERLIQAGFLRSAMNGWLFSGSPFSGPSDSTLWYACFWEFCAAYCRERFGRDWHLSAERSLLLHAENTAIPERAIVFSPKGANNLVRLPFGTSLYDLRQSNAPPENDLAQRDGLRILVPEAALVRVPEAFFVRHPVEARVVLSSVRDAGDVLRRLLDGGRSVVAGRLAGALRRVGRGEAADEIRSVMRCIGYDFRETDPFEPNQAIGAPIGAAAPVVGRLRSLWEAMRDAVIAEFPEAPGLPEEPGAYLSLVDGIYREDAYHSLSMEGYRVTPELIDRASKGDFDPDRFAADRRSRDAMAAYGYWRAFRSVRTAVEDILHGRDAVSLVQGEHRDWYRELFRPYVRTGLIEDFALVGYRNDAVFLRGSRHVPPRSEAVRDAMPALFELMGAEAEPSVRAVLGHWLFGYVHPFSDGNGRIARFLMNAMLASGGYPWTVIRVEDRDAYLTALECASVDLDIVPFARFAAERVERSLARAGQS